MADSEEGKSPDGVKPRASRGCRFGKDALATPQQSLALQTDGSHPIIGRQVLQDPFWHELTSHHAFWAIVIPLASTYPVSPPSLRRL